MSEKPISRSIPSMAVLSMIVFSLAGCGEKIDARQVQDVNGLMYKLNQSDPFSGTVSNYEYLGAICDLPVKKGIVDGTMSCQTKDGVKVLEAEFSAGKKSGLEKDWDVTSKALSAKIEWKDGQKNGLEERFNANGKTIRQTNWVAGEKSGNDKLWNADGSVLLADLNWSDEKATGFIKEYGPDGQLVADLQLKDGLASGSGLWTNKSQALLVYRIDPGTIRFDGTATSSDGPGWITNHWKAGKIDGLEQQFDASGKIISTRNYKDGLLVPVVQDQTVASQDSPPPPSEAPIAPPATAQTESASLVETGPFSPSFNCDKASSYQERLICSDRNLSKLDVDLTAAYSAALAKATDKHQIKSDEVAWVKTSRNTCADRNCMVQAYQQRIAALSK